MWFSLAGVGWSQGFITRTYWEEGEGEIGVTFAVIALVVWLILLRVFAAVLRGSSSAESRGARTTSLTLTVTSVAVVLGLCTLAIAWPELPSEYPSPPWNRA